MKLEKPIVFKNIFNIFDDERGFLSTLDVKKLCQNLPVQNFDLTYQLISYSTKKIPLEACIIKLPHMLKIN